ncbi:hypothetical protein F511_07929 [Dorcoceras hygrometricum]|uniref:Uncharacterized protein n=1 Tax=Dorcoceras hygrometricum TaxID=472368 RepID=A0A2Z7D0S6_9LAMI|nr:hypothetical protein F511_07929 [Dorcoceras hygrometricum]
MIGDRSYDEVTVIEMNRMFIRWTRARWADPSLSQVYLIRLKGFITNDENHNNYIAQNPNPRALKAAASLPLLTPPPPLVAAAAASLAGICSGQLFEENPLVIKSISLLVQADRREIVSGRGPD